jgi:hypothetical protein
MSHRIRFLERFKESSLSNLSFSAMLFLSNTGISILVALIVVLNFGWGDYGTLITVLSFSFILNQIATGGSQNEIVKVNADIPHVNLKSLYREGAKSKRLSNMLVSSVIFFVMIGNFFGFIEIKNFDTYILLILLTSSLVAPSLRIRLSLYAANDRFKSYFLISLVRNVVFLMMVMISTILSSNELLFASFLFADVLIALSLTSAFRKIAEKGDSNIKPFDTRSTFRFTCLNVYHELIPKIDLFCLFFLADPALIGKYSILALMSEGMHSLYAAIRAQNTPKFSSLGVPEKYSLSTDFSRYVFVSIVILSMACAAFIAIYFLKIFSFDNGLLLIFLLALNSIILLYPIIYASVLTQWGMQTLQLKLSVTHLFLSILCFIIGFYVTGLAMALGSLSVANSLFAFAVYYSLRKANPYRAQL